MIHCFLHAPNYFVCIPIAEFFTFIKFWSTLRDLHLLKMVMECRQGAHYVPCRTLCFTCIMSLKLNNPVQRSCVVNPILQIRKLGFRELSSFAQLLYDGAAIWIYISLTLLLFPYKKLYFYLHCLGTLGSWMLAQYIRHSKWIHAIPYPSSGSRNRQHWITVGLFPTWGSNWQHQPMRLACVMSSTGAELGCTGSKKASLILPLRCVFA